MQIKDQRACKATNAKQRISPHPDTPKTQEVRRHQRSVTPQADDVMEGFLPHKQEQKRASKSSSSSETSEQPDGCHLQSPFPVFQNLDVEVTSLMS